MALKIALKNISAGAAEEKNGIMAVKNKNHNKNSPVWVKKVML